jgi:hypothetical protein
MASVPKANLTDWRMTALRQKRPWVLIRSGDGKSRTLPLSCVLMRWDRIAFALEFAAELDLDPRRQVRHILLHLGDVGFLVRSTRRDQGYDHLRLQCQSHPCRLAMTVPWPAPDSAGS